MPISGLRVRLAQDGDAANRAIAALSDDARVDIGVRRGPHVAIVLETSHPDEDKRAWHWINEMPGVRQVDVVFVSLDPTLEASAGSVRGTQGETT